VSSSLKAQLLPLKTGVVTLLMSNAYASLLVSWKSGVTTGKYMCKRGLPKPEPKSTPRMT